MQEIDFVVLWVDGNDPAWQADKARFSATKDTDVRPTAIGTGIICNTGFVAWRNSHPG